MNGFLPLHHLMLRALGAAVSVLALLPEGESGKPRGIMLFARVRALPVAIRAEDVASDEHVAFSF
jgi:hypothetical protein